MRFEKVKYIKKVGEKPTKDLEVSSIDHNFIANGMVVSNSHSTSYACTAYICAWLKNKYPLEWWTAILQNSTHDDLKQNAKYFVKYLMHPDINLSDVDFYIINDLKQKIVYPLSMIKGVKNAADEIVKHKPFESLEDFLNKVEKRKVNKKVVSAMIWAGAFDEMPEAGNGPVWEKRNALFKKFKEIRKEIPPENFSKGTVLKMESAAMCIGEPDFYALYKQRYPASSLVPIENIKKMKEGSSVGTIGIITGVRALKTKKGDDMCFVDLSNAEHVISVTFFPKEYEMYQQHLEKDNILRVTGTVNTYNGKVSVIAKSAIFYDIDSL